MHTCINTCTIRVVKCQTLGAANSMSQEINQRLEPIGITIIHCFREALSFNILQLLLFQIGLIDRLLTLIKRTGISVSVKFAATFVTSCKQKAKLCLIAATTFTLCPLPHTHTPTQFWKAIYTNYQFRVSCVLQRGIHNIARGENG